MPDKTPLSSWLAEVEARLAKATPSPWIAKWSGYRGVYDSKGARIFDIATNTPDDDAQFIAHAPTDLAQAIRLVKVAQQMAEKMSQVEALYPLDLPEAFKDIAQLRVVLTHWHQAVEGLQTGG